MRTDIINGIIEANGYVSYLEIGVADGRNLDGVFCSVKKGVDPEPERPNVMVYSGTSDEFFSSTSEKFDLIFIDGLHHSEQVERDIVNSYARLNKGGAILVHDCIPPNEICTRMPRETREWCGDVFRATSGFIKTYGSKIRHEFLEDPYGLLMIKKTGMYKVEPIFNRKHLSYQEWKSEI